MLRMFRTAALLLALALVIGMAQAPRAQSSKSAPSGKAPIHDVAAQKNYGTHFQTSDRCFPCHNGITTPSGEDISIGINWRTSMMANAGRDPYWMAGVRRETIDHPDRRRTHSGRVLHLPHADDALRSKAGGRQKGRRFAHLPPDPSKLGDRLADDGVSCSVCHQITGSESWQAGELRRRLQDRREERSRASGTSIGPFDVEHGPSRRSCIRRRTFQPIEGQHIRSVRALRHVPHAAHAGARRRRAR